MLDRSRLLRRPLYEGSRREPRHLRCRVGVGRGRLYHGGHGLRPHRCLQREPLLQPLLRALCRDGHQHLSAAERLPPHGRALSEGHRLLRRDRPARRHPGQHHVQQGGRRDGRPLRPGPQVQPRRLDLPSLDVLVSSDRPLLLRHRAAGQDELRAGQPRHPALPRRNGCRLHESAAGRHGLRIQRRLLQQAVHAECGGRPRVLGRCVSAHRLDVHDHRRLLRGRALRHRRGLHQRHVRFGRSDRRRWSRQRKRQQWRHNWRRRRDHVLAVRPAVRIVRCVLQRHALHERLLRDRGQLTGVVPVTARPTRSTTTRQPPRQQPRPARGACRGGDRRGP
jgi:hypothetical protein